MADDEKSVVPVWTLATAGNAKAPTWASDDRLTPAGLSELRDALAAFAESPVVTLEAHPMPKKLDQSAGMTRGQVDDLLRTVYRLRECPRRRHRDR